MSDNKACYEIPVTKSSRPSLHSLSLSLSHSLSLTLTHTRSLTLTHSLPLNLALTHSHSHSSSLTFTHSPSSSLTFTHPLYSLTHENSLTLTLTSRPLNTQFTHQLATSRTHKNHTHTPSSAGSHVHPVRFRDRLWNRGHARALSERHMRGWNRCQRN